MNFRKLERSREIRLWVRQIIFPVASIIAFVTFVPEVNDIFKSKIKEAKKKLRDMLDKE